MNSLLKKLKLCLITNINNQPFPQYIEFIKQTINGGITMVQLREKNTDYREMVFRALELKKLLQPLNIPLIINDFVDLAAEIDADGVHIGNQDMSALKAREMLGENKIIGLSIESNEDIKHANKLSVNYVTASAIFSTKTKQNCKKLWGIEGLKEVVKNSIHPVTAIGGIEPNHCRDIINSGAVGVAVIGAIHNSTNPLQTTKDFINNMENI